MPGRMVNTPAAASTPQSMPEADTVRVITAAIGLAFTEVNVRASSSSTQENMKQKNAVTPMPEPINGMKIFTKNLGKL
ncbi:hypothetical protein D3C87_1483720 [compost metagenome]